MDQTLLDLYHRHVGTGFDRQLRLADFLDRKAAGQPWEYDTETATLTFGPKVKFEAPVIGSHADHNNSWLWSWSNKHIKLTLTNRALGDTVRMLVHRLGAHPLAAPGFAIEPLLGDELTEHAAHVLGIVLGRELQYDAYYLAPYDGGRALLLVRDDRLHFTERHPLHRVLSVFPQVVAGLPVFDHKSALRDYARDYGLTVADVPGGLKVTGEGDGLLTATFDDRGRLAKLDGFGLPAMKQPAPPRPAAKKPAAGAKKKPARAASAVKKVVKTVKAAVKKAAAAVKKAVAKKPARPAKPTKPAAAKKKPAAAAKTKAAPAKKKPAGPAGKKRK
jgi:hypothetical protein